MGLRNPNMVETTTGTTDLELEMSSQESALVKSIRWHEPDGVAEDLKLTIDRKSVLQIKAPAGWRVCGGKRYDGYMPICDVLAEHGLWPYIPLGSGQKLTLTGGTANDVIEVVYDLYDADDMRPDMDNGSASSRFPLIQFVSNSSIVTSAGDWELDQSDLDAEFIDFPGGKTVPGNTRMEMLALFGAAASKGTGAAHSQDVERLKFLRDRVALFDDDLAGIYYQGDVSVTAADVAYKTIVGRMSAGLQYIPPAIIVFPTPLVFHAGDEMNIFAVVDEENAGGDFAAGEIVLGMLFDVHRLGS
jgi:hypothetical protein